MKTLLKVLLPVLALLVGGVVIYIMVRNREPVPSQDLVKEYPMVRVTVAVPKRISLQVHSQGTVEPGTEINLISEVSGTILKVSRALGAGGYFEQGDPLLEIDAVVYELAVVQAKARLLETKARLMREEAEADVARIEWDELGNESTPSPLLLREPQMAEAIAAVESANANVRLAERDLEKTKIKAPFAGRVLSTSADIGQSKGSANTGWNGVLRVSSAAVFRGPCGPGWSVQ